MTAAPPTTDPDLGRWERPAFAAAVAGWVALRWVAAARWDLLADEAYHWTWSLRPALGYFDQPPLVAWLLGLGRLVGGDHPLALRLPGLLLTGAAFVALLPFAADRPTFARLFLGLPALVFLTTLAVPDAALLACWGLATAAALQGGRGWWLAGLFGGLAALAKHDGLLVFPLLWLGAPAAEKRGSAAVIGLGTLLVVVAPHLAWLATHDFVTLRFQLGEGLLHPAPPGLWGPVRVVLEQAGLVLVVPLVVLGVASVRAWQAGDRVDRLLAASSLPVGLLFLAASPFGPPEAHWPAPMWVGGSVLLARTTGRWADAAAVGSWLGLFASAALAVHVERPLVRLPRDPAVRFTEGRILADEVGREALPERVGPREPGAAAVTNVFTERYQEASLVRWYTGIPARVFPGCGRPSQDDLWPAPVVPDRFLFVRPARSGPPTCVGPVGGTQRVLRETDRRGRRVPEVDLFWLQGQAP